MVSHIDSYCMVELHSGLLRFWFSLGHWGGSGAVRLFLLVFVHFLFSGDLGTYSLFCFLTLGELRSLSNGADSPFSGHVSLLL